MLRKKYGNYFKFVIMRTLLLLTRPPPFVSTWIEFIQLLSKVVFNLQFFPLCKETSPSRYCTQLFYVCLTLCCRMDRMWLVILSRAASSYQASTTFLNSNQMWCINLVQVVVAWEKVCWAVVCPVYLQRCHHQKHQMNQRYRKVCATLVTTCSEWKLAFAVWLDWWFFIMADSVLFIT